jgi:hypothetical protein
MGIHKVDQPDQRDPKPFYRTRVSADFPQLGGVVSKKRIVSYSAELRHARLGDSRRFLMDVLMEFIAPYLIVFAIIVAVMILRIERKRTRKQR